MAKTKAMNGQNKAAILAIGTEITNGQILNRNASWISEQLLRHGLQVLFHRTVGDDRSLIRGELAELESKVDLLFVTGGLGPTTDDFTRDCISEWAARPLEWNEESWAWIEDRFKQRGLRVHEFQRQQCFFPKGSRILHNHQGTAHGFTFHLPNKGFSRTGLHVFVLPGPPREVDAVWSNGIQPWIAEQYRHLDRWLVTSWDCLGVGESEVAHRVENALENCPFEKGYRVHVPYVEFKLSYPQTRQAEAQLWLHKVEEVLGDLIVARNGEDPAAAWIKSLHGFSEVWISDKVSNGYLLQRLAPFLKSEKLKTRLHLLQGDLPSGEDFSSSSLRVSVEEKPHHWAEISWQSGSATACIRHKCVVAAPFRPSAVTRERELQYFVERALLFWRQQCDTSGAS